MTPDEMRAYNNHDWAIVGGMVALAIVAAIIASFFGPIWLLIQSGIAAVVGIFTLT